MTSNTLAKDPDYSFTTGLTAASVYYFNSTSDYSGYTSAKVYIDSACTAAAARARVVGRTAAVAALAERAVRAANLRRRRRNARVCAVGITASITVQTAKFVSGTTGLTTGGKTGSGQFRLTVINQPPTANQAVTFSNQKLGSVELNVASGVCAVPPVVPPP